MSKKILITGAGGYIGSITAYTFLSQGWEVVALDNFCTGYKEPLKVLQDKFGQEKFRFYQVDLREDLKDIFNKEKGIAAVVHFAAHCQVDESMKNPQKYFSNNVCGSQSLFAAILEAGIKNLVFSSTCAVYGEAEYVPVDEHHPTTPKNPYGQSKRMVEEILQWYGKLVELNYVVLRYFNVCGALADGTLGDSKRPSVLLVQNAVRGALGIEPFFLTCPQVDTPDKTPVRDYINVNDLAAAHLQAVDYLLGGGKSEIVNLGTGTGNSVLEVVDKVKQVTGIKFEVPKTQARQGEYATMIANIDKAKKVLGWQPQHSLEDSITSLVKWYQSHPKGWES